MNAVVKHRPRSAKEQQDGWASFLRVLARNSKLKFRIGKNVGPSTDGKTINLPALPANLTPGRPGAVQALWLSRGWSLHAQRH